MTFLYGALKDVMKLKGVTQAALAEKLGINVATLNLKMSNKSDWKQYEIIKACDCLEIPYCDISKYFFAK